MSLRWPIFRWHLPQRSRTMAGPFIDHWVVTVARAAGLEGIDRLEIDSAVSTSEAWSLVAMAAGVSLDELARRVARHFRLAIADLENRDAHAEKIIPGRVARRLQVVPLRYTDRSLTVASADPVHMEAERELTALAARSIQPEVASPAAIEEAIARAYPG